MNAKKIHLQSKCTIQVERKKEKRQTVNYVQKSVNSKSTKWQEQQISANPVSTLGPSSTTESGVGKRSQAGLSLLDEIHASTRGFCAILSRDLVAQVRRWSFT